MSTTAATTNTVDYVFAFFSDNNNTAYYSVGPGYGNIEASEDVVTGSGDSAFSEDEVVLATGVQTATATSTLSDTQANVIVALETSGTPLTATPAFSPSGGSFIAGQSVSISDATSGASIYYTTDGTTPTTDSTAYAGAITVAATETWKRSPQRPAFRQVRWVRRRSPSAPLAGRS